jgi:hypothetical protein
VLEGRLRGLTPDRLAIDLQRGGASHPSLLRVAHSARSRRVDLLEPSRAVNHSETDPLPGASSLPSRAGRSPVARNGRLTKGLLRPGRKRRAGLSPTRTLGQRSSIGCILSPSKILVGANRQDRRARASAGQLRGVREQIDPDRTGLRQTAREPGAPVLLVLFAAKADLHGPLPPAVASPERAGRDRTTNLAKTVGARMAPGGAAPERDAVDHAQAGIPGRVSVRSVRSRAKAVLLPADHHVLTHRGPKALRDLALAAMIHAPSARQAEDGSPSQTSLGNLGVASLGPVIASNPSRGPSLGDSRNRGPRGPATKANRAAVAPNAAAHDPAGKSADKS